MGEIVHAEYCALGPRFRTMRYARSKLSRYCCELTGFTFFVTWRASLAGKAFSPALLSWIVSPSISSNGF